MTKLPMQSEAATLLCARSGRGWLVRRIHDSMAGMTGDMIDIRVTLPITECPEEFGWALFRRFMDCHREVLRASAESLDGRAKYIIQYGGQTLAAFRALVKS